MSNKRMAGQSLAARNRAARERLSNNPKTLASRVAKAKSSKYDLSGFSDKEISMAMQGSGFDQFDYARLTGKPVGGDICRALADLLRAFPAVMTVVSLMTSQYLASL